jgi:hypothetical protein
MMMSGRNPVSKRHDTLKALLALSVPLLSASLQEAQAPWTTDVQAARASAVRQARPCVIFLYIDSL